MVLAVLCLPQQLYKKYVKYFIYSLNRIEIMSRNIATCEKKCLCRPELLYFNFVSQTIPETRQVSVELLSRHQYQEFSSSNFRHLMSRKKIEYSKGIVCAFKLDKLGLAINLEI